MIILRCQLKPEDYIKAQYLHMRPNLWSIVISLGIALSSLLFVFMLLPPSLFELVFSFSSSLLLTFFLIYVLRVFILIPRSSYRIFKQQKSLHIEYETVIFPERFEATSVQGTMKMNFSDFHKYKFNKNMILLYQSQCLFHMFPRRCFTSEEDFKIFLSYLQSNLVNSNS